MLTRHCGRRKKERHGCCAVVHHFHLQPIDAPQYLVYSDIHKLRVYALHPTAPGPPGPPTRVPLDPTAEALHALCTLCFAGDHLLAADVHGTVSMLALPSCQVVCRWDEPKAAAVRAAGAATGFDARATAAAALGSTALGGDADPCSPLPVSVMHASADGRCVGSEHMCML